MESHHNIDQTIAILLLKMSSSPKGKFCAGKDSVVPTHELHHHCAGCKMCIYFLVMLSPKKCYISRKTTLFAKVVILRYLAVVQLSQSVVVELLQEEQE